MLYNLHLMKLKTPPSEEPGSGEKGCPTDAPQHRMPLTAEPQPQAAFNPTPGGKGVLHPSMESHLLQVQPQARGSSAPQDTATAEAHQKPLFSPPVSMTGGGGVSEVSSA